MRGTILLLVLSIAAAPASLAGQRPSPRAEAPAREHRGPIQLLLQRRAELRLSDQQVARLEAIRRETEERNGPLIAQLLEIRRGMPRGTPPRRMTEAQRAEFREGVQRARPLLTRIRQNNHAAMREVGRVLTDEQRAMVREMIREHRPPRGRRPGPRGPRDHGPGHRGG